MNAIANIASRHKVMSVVVLGTAIVLIANLMAMQLTDRVSWSAFDFALITVFLLSAGLFLELAISAFRTSTIRWSIGAAVVIAAAILFVELSVGLVGSPIAGS